MSKASIAFKQYRQSLINQGKFEMALEIKKVDGIDKAIAMSGFSRAELESGKLNDR